MINKDDFIESFEEYLKGAKCEEKNKRFKCAVCLYYKALVELFDFVLLRDYNHEVKNNEDRRNKLTEVNSDIYKVYVDSFGIYRGAYTVSRDIRDCNFLKESIKKMIFLKGLKDEGFRFDNQKA